MFFGSTLVLKAVETKWKLHILVDWIDKKGEKRPEYKGKDCHVRRVRIVNISLGTPEYPAKAIWGSPKKRIRSNRTTL
jgi:hypothetical protein